MSNDIVKKVISTFHSKSLNIFSIREREIVSLLRQGETYKSIGEKLHVSVSTVSFHIQNIYFKLDVNSKAEALKRLRQIE